MANKTYELTFELTNGSKQTVRFDVPLSEGSLPDVSAENNGSFLQVVDGVWAVVQLTDVSVEGA